MSFTRFAVVCGVASVVLVCLATWLDHTACKQRAQLMAEAFSYTPIQGCMVKVRGRWLPIEAFRDVGLEDGR